MDSKLLFHAPTEHTFPIEKTLLLAETDLPPVMKLLFHIKFNENEVGLSVALFRIQFIVRCQMEVDGRWDSARRRVFPIPLGKVVAVRSICSSHSSQCKFLMYVSWIRFSMHNQLYFVCMSYL